MNKDKKGEIKGNATCQQRGAQRVKLAAADISPSASGADRGPGIEAASKSIGSLMNKDKKEIERYCYLST